MPTRFGADGGFNATTSGGVFDASGNPIVSADNDFGGIPLGPAALAQTLFSIPNGTFNILPLDIAQPISNENPLPYWSTPLDDSDGIMTAKVVFDETSNTYSLRMSPGTAPSGYSLSIATRSAVISDDNLSLRQKAIATLSKVGTYAGTTQVNLKLDATYYDHTGTQLSSVAIGTVFDNGTFSSITGFTTAGTAIVGISAAYVDLTFTMTATANVTSGIAFDIDTILLQTSQGGGGQSFLITDTFTSSGTWTRPTGVDHIIAVVGIGAGGGGGSGGLSSALTDASAVRRGGGGGGGGRWAIIRDINVQNEATISVGIGSGGSGGGAPATLIKTTGNATNQTSNGSAGSSGGTTTFGTFLTIPGGGGGGAGGASSSGAGGATAGSATTPLFQSLSQIAGGTGSSGESNGQTAQAGGVNSYPQVPYTVIATGTGTSGGSATLSGGTGAVVIHIPGAGGTAGSTGYNGGGGGANLRVSGTNVRWSGTAGIGGGAAISQGSGGGGSGALSVQGGTGTGAGGSAQFRDSAGTIVGAAGAAGSDGAIFVVYVA